MLELILPMVAAEAFTIALFGFAFRLYFVGQTAGISHRHRHHTMNYNALGIVCACCGKQNIQHASDRIALQVIFVAASTMNTQ